MLYQAFYYLTAIGEEVPSSKPRQMTPAQIYRDLVLLLNHEDDYVGLMDAADNVLQITRPQSDSYWVELPLLDERVSYGSLLSGQELRDLLEKLPAVFRPARFPDFKRSAW